MTHPGEKQGLHHGGGRAASREAVRELRSRPRLRGDLGRAPLLFTGRHECEHGHGRARARVGREAGVCVSDARCQMPATERGPWGGYYLRLEALKRLAPKRYSHHSAATSPLLRAARPLASSSPRLIGDLGTLAFPTLRRQSTLPPHRPTLPARLLARSAGSACQRGRRCRRCRRCRLCQPDSAGCLFWAATYVQRPVAVRVSI